MYGIEEHMRDGSAREKVEQDSCSLNRFGTNFLAPDLGLGLGLGLGRE